MRGFQIITNLSKYSSKAYISLNKLKYCLIILDLNEQKRAWYSGVVEEVLSTLG